MQTLPINPRTLSAAALFAVTTTLFAATSADRVASPELPLGTMFMGLFGGVAIFLYGMEKMAHGLKTIAGDSMRTLLARLTRNRVAGVATGALVTAVIQSSSVTTVLTLGFVTAGVLNLSHAVGVIFGANIGTCVTAFLASVGKSVEARRTSMVHILFNICGVLVWVGLVGMLADLVVWMSPKSPEFEGIARLAVETPRQIANAHTVFNISCTLLFLPFTQLFTRLAIRLVPEREATRGPVDAVTVHLDPSLLLVPPVALEQVRGEIVKMGEKVGVMVRDFMPAFLSNDSDALDDILNRDDTIDAIDREIGDYLVQIGHRDLTPEQSREQTALLNIANELEHCGDVVEKNLVSLGRKKIAQALSFSGEAEDELGVFMGRVRHSFDQAMAAVVAKSPDVTAELAVRGRELRDLEQTYRSRHYRRLNAGDRGTMERNQIYVDCLDYLRRIHEYAERIAAEAGRHGDR